jgi:heme exporter protein B
MFGARATDVATGGADPTALYLILGAFLFLGLSLAPIAAGAAIRIALD